MGKIIVNFMGGLGNQMSQYVMYKNLVKRLGPDRVGITKEWYKNRISHNGYELDKVFGIRPQEFDVKDAILIEEKLSTYNEEYFHLPDNEDYLLMGYYGHEQYLLNVEDEVRKDFIFSRDLNEEFSELISKMKNKNSVAIHLRRGDFHEAKIDNNPIAFFEDAVEEMLKRISNAEFFIFSDDPAFAKEKFACLENKNFITENRGKNSYKDLFLMSRCQNFIMAPNSTFSFWGSWLSENKEKIALTAGFTSNYPGYLNWGIDFAKREENKPRAKITSGGGRISLYYALYDKIGNMSKYIAVSMRSVADNTSAKISFHILHTNNLKNDTKEKFLELAKEIKLDLIFHDLPFLNEGLPNDIDRRNFPEKLLSFFKESNFVKKNETAVFMLSPAILNRDILEILDEKNLKNKPGIFPLFKKEYNIFDFGEEVTENFLLNFAKTPFLDGVALKRIIIQFLASKNEKMYEIRSVYNLILKSKHKVFFTTEERYNNYITKHLFNKETDKIIFVKDKDFNDFNNEKNINILMELLKSIENVDTLLILFTDLYVILSMVLKKFDKIEGVDFTDGRVILTGREGGVSHFDINLLFRDV